MQTNNKSPRIAFFGTPEFAVFVLEELKKKNIIPDVLVTAPDKPKGRKLVVTPPPAKIWAKENDIAVIQPESLKNGLALPDKEYDLFIIAAYGKIIPKSILDMPKYGSLNVHPSLLPEFRGASPIQSAILEANETGTTIMLMDEELDHGPIIMQEIISDQLPIERSVLEKKLAKLGGKLLSEVIPEWIAKNIDPQEQDHERATYTKKITKEDGLIDLKANGLVNYRKFCAFLGWPGTYFFTEKDGKKVRVIIKNAELKGGKFKIKTVLPEGKTVINWEDFQKN